MYFTNVVKLIFHGNYMKIEFLRRGQKIWTFKQDHQALLEAKYCPRVATASPAHRKTHKKPCDVNL